MGAIAGNVTQATAQCMPRSGNLRLEGESLPVQWPATEAISIASWYAIAAESALAMDADVTNIAIATRSDASKFIILLDAWAMGVNGSNPFRTLHAP